MSPDQGAMDLRARVLAEAARTPSPTRAIHQRRARLIATLGIVATGLTFLALGGVSVGSRPAAMFAVTVGAGLVAVAILTRVSSVGPGSMLGRPRSVLLTASIATAPLLALVALGVAVAWPEQGAEHYGCSADLACGLVTVAQGIVPLLGLLVYRRGSDPVHPALSGAALGMTAGTWAVVMAYLRCSHAGVLHCLAAHVAPAVALTLVGAAVGFRVLRMK